MDTNFVTPSAYEPTPENRYIYYEFLHFIPKDQKNKYWAAQCLLFNKYNAERPVPLGKIREYRLLDRGGIDVARYKKIIDPVQPDGTGGTAQYFSSTWEPNPINIHLKNILDAKLDKLPVQLFVKAADEYFQLKLQKENSKIMGRKQFVTLLNDLNEKVGLPLLNLDDDPFKYAQQLASNMRSGEANVSDATRAKDPQKDLAITLMDNIKTVIEDNEDLALFNEYVYKDGVEVACEVGMQYYMEVNKWSVLSDKTKMDIRNFNCSAARFYTSQTTGRPILEYLDLENVWTSPFYKEDGSDILYWWREYDVTFGEFVRQFGANLSTDELKIIFDRNRSQRGNWNSATGLAYESCTPLQRENAKIRIGYMEWMTQDIAVYGEGTVQNNMRFKEMPSDWRPQKNKPFNREERYYNMWYKCYYIPAFTGTAPATWQTSDFLLQAQFIFDFGPLQDQMREGDDQRYSRSSLVIWRSFKPSWTDIEQKFMPKINLVWMQFENDLSNAVPHGMWFSEEAFSELMNVVDEAENSGKDNQYEAIRKLKQTGYGVGKLMSELGQRVPPFVEIKTNHLASAQEKLTIIMNLYQMMVQSLGMNEITEGQGPKPRQSLGAIDQAVNVSSNATYFIEKGFLDIYKELGFRLLTYFKEVVSEKDSDRCKEFENIVGNASAWALEAIAEIPYRKLALLVDAINTQDQNNLLNQMALQMSQGPQPLLTPDEAIELTFIENVKYKFAILRLKVKKAKRELEQQQQQAAQVASQAQIEQVQIQAQLQQQKDQAQAQLINITKQWDERLLSLDAQLKYQNQSQLKEQIKNNRIDQERAMMEMEENKNAQAPLV